MNSEHRTQVFGHRGYASKYPENTRSSFLAALELGVDGLEFDIHFSKDGEIVVIHDEHLDRTTNGKGLVVQHTLAELKELDAGSSFSEEFRGERILTLEELLHLVVEWGKPVRLNIESKSGVVPYPGLEERAYQMVVQHGLADNVIFSSFNHYVLRDLKKSHPDVSIGLLYMEGLVDPWVYANYLDAQALHPLYLSIDESVVQGAHQTGLAVNPFTVNDEKDMVRLQQWGVDAILTDRPDVLLALQGRR